MSIEVLVFKRAVCDVDHRQGVVDVSKPRSVQAHLNLEAIGDSEPSSVVTCAIYALPAGKAFEDVAKRRSCP